MGLTKKAPKQLSAAATNTKKGVENPPRKSGEPVNPWAILDEIEAPMWVDLALECDSTYEDKDDEWFHVSHPFHRCSAKQLISKLSNSVECGMNLAFDVLGSSSPKLPPSVSKSRGRDYKSGKHEPVVCTFALNKQNLSKSLSSKSLSIDAGSGKNAIDGKVTDRRNYKSDSVGEGTLDETTSDVFTKSVSSFTDGKTSVKSLAFGGGGSNSTSTITPDTAGWNLLEASTGPFGLGSRSLLNLRDSLRKSYVTRQASRLVIKGVWQSEGQNSSSSKSSVGSSSLPGCDGMNSVVSENTDKTPDSRNMTTMFQLQTNKVNQANGHKAPAAQAQNISYESHFIIKREASKTMGHKKHTEGCVTRKVNKCIPLATAKNSIRATTVNQSSKTVNGGKENEYGKMALGIKSSMMLKEGEGPLEDAKLVKRKVHQKSDRTKLVGQRENARGGTKVKKSLRVVETVYFR